LNPFAPWYQPSAGSFNGSSATKTMIQRLDIIEAALVARAPKTPNGAAVGTRDGQEPTRAVKVFSAVTAVEEERAEVGVCEEPSFGEEMSSRAAPVEVELPSNRIRAARNECWKINSSVAAAGEGLDVARAEEASLQVTATSRVDRAPSG
jgi:hypothetical protein